MDNLLNKTFVVVVENGTENNSDKVCFIRSVIDDDGKVYNEFSPLRSKAHHFETKEDADKCCESIKDSGYISWVETFYKV